MNLPPSWEHWIDNLMLTGFAASAGFLGYLMRNSNNRRKISWGRSLLEAAASGFVGFMTVLLCQAMNLSYEWTGFLSGLLGWLGATTSIQLFERIVRRKLGLDDAGVDYHLGEKLSDKVRPVPADTDRPS